MAQRKTEICMEVVEQQREINHAALTYLDLWAAMDRDLLDGFQSAEPAERAATLYRLAVKYRVARGISARDDDGEKLEKAARNERWAEIVEIVCEHVEMRDDDCDVVTHLVQALRHYAAIDGSQLTSAATKFLWFAGRHTIRIYDDRALRALRPGDEGKWTEMKGYSWFEKSWASHEKDRAEQLGRAIARLEQQFAWSGVPGGMQSEALQKIPLPWFRDRIFDQYLWAKGDPDLKRGGT